MAGFWTRSLRRSPILVDPFSRRPSRFLWSSGLPTSDLFGTPSTAPSTHIKENGKIPVTIISGFLGSGKTSLLKNFLENKPTGLERPLLVIDDACNPGYDAITLRHNLFILNPDHGTIVESYPRSQNVSRREALRQTIDEAVKSRSYDHLFVELGGLTGTSHAVSTIEELIEQGHPLVMDSVISVMDPVLFSTHVSSGVDLLLSRMENLRNQSQLIARLLINQVEHSDTVLLHVNHDPDDIRGVEALAQTRRLVKAANPSVHLVETLYGRSPSSIFYGTRKAKQSSHGNESISLGKKSLEHIDFSKELDKLGLVLHRYIRPSFAFHPARLTKLVESPLSTALFSSVLRLKGVFPMANDKITQYSLSHISGRTSWASSGLWAFAGMEAMTSAAVKAHAEKNLAASGRREQLHQFYANECAHLRNQGIWDEKQGDRRIDLTFLAPADALNDIVQGLDRCIATRAEELAGIKIERADLFERIFDGKSRFGGGGFAGDTQNHGALRGSTNAGI